MQADESLEFMLSEEGEQIVRSYECTRIKPLFAPEAIGRLTVTNKRIVYHSHGRSMTGQSVLVSEMPVEDSASVGVYLGNTINWLLFIAFAIGVYVASSLVDAVLPAFFTSWILGVLLMLPYAIRWLFASKWLSDDVKKQAAASLQGLVDKTGQRWDGARWDPIFGILLKVGVLIFAWSIAHSPAVRYGLPFLDVVVLLAVYFLLFLSWFGRQKVFTLVVGSRTAQGSGIYIPGVSAFLTGNRTAADTLVGRPAADANTLARELGALLTDIRQLGDLGVQKWQAQ